MVKQGLNKIAFDNIYDSSDPFMIRNFILSDNVKVPADLSLEDPFMFDGIILALCIKGSGKIKINFKEFDITQNTILTILPKQIFKMIKQSEDLLLEALFFSFDFIVGLPVPKDFDVIRNMGNNPCIGVSKEKMQDLLEFHAFILKQYNKTDQQFRESIVKSLLYSLILKVDSIYQQTPVKETKKSSRQEELTNKFFDVLLQHYKQERNVSFYADKLCLTSKYLSSTIKKITSHSILEWINEAVIIEAKTILKTTDLTVLQISEELNFPNPSFFCRFFKQYTGITPLKYRES